MTDRGYPMLFADLDLVYKGVRYVQADGRVFFRARDALNRIQYLTPIKRNVTFFNDEHPNVLVLMDGDRAAYVPVSHALVFLHYFLNPVKSRVISTPEQQAQWVRNVYMAIDALDMEGLPEDFCPNEQLKQVQASYEQAKSAKQETEMSVEKPVEKPKSDSTSALIEYLKSQNEARYKEAEIQAQQAERMATLIEKQNLLLEQLAEQALRQTIAMESSTKAMETTTLRLEHMDTMLDAVARQTELNSAVRKMLHDLGCEIPE